MAEARHSTLTEAVDLPGVISLAAIRSSWSPLRLAIQCFFAARCAIVQRHGIKEVDDGIWLVSFMHYDLGYFDLEQKTLQPLDSPFGTRLSPMS